MVAVLAAPVFGQDDARAPDQTLGFNFSLSSLDYPPTAAAANQPKEDKPDEIASPSRKSGDEWEFTLSPYLWATSLSADVNAGSISTSADACFSELAKQLKMGGFLRFEGLRDHWGFYLDGTYVELGDDARVKVGPFRVRGIDVDMNFTDGWLDFGGFYRFGDPGWSFDLMLGGRYEYVSADVSLGPFIDADISEHCVSPVVGGRVEYGLSSKWTASLKSDAGGFGVGDAADLVWGITALIGYRLSKSTMFGFGYKYYDIELSSGHVDADVQFHGPVVGVSFKF